MEKKEKQKIINGIILNSVFILAMIFVIFQFIIPKYIDFDNNIKTANEIDSKLQNIKNFGFNVEELKSILTKDSSNKSIIDLLSDEEKIKNIISKPANYPGNYDTWIQKEIEKETDFNKEIEKNNKILGSIIPTFIDYYDNKGVDSSISLNVQNKITLNSFITYIEEQIIKKYNLDSYSPVGIENIVFNNNSDANIGSFKINIDFEGKNSDIRNFLNQINKTGKLTIDKDGKLSLDSSSPNSNGLGDNLLITIDTLKLAETLSSDDINKGSITLRFYVKGIGFDEFNQIKNKITKEFDTLSKNIVRDSKICDKGINTICNNAKGSQAISAIKLLNSELVSMKQQIESLSKDTKNTNFNEEIESLFKIYSSIQNIDSKYNEKMDIIKKIK